MKASLGVDMREDSKSVAGFIRPAAVLAFGVVAWEHGIHTSLLGHADGNGWLPHIARDGALAMPLALLAFVVGLRLAARSGAQTRAGHAAAVAIVFGLLIAPSVSAHGWIDSHIDHRAEVVHVIPTEPDPATHALRDSSIALVAAFPLALLGLAHMSVGAPSRRRRAQIRPRWRMSVLATAVALSTVGAPPVPVRAASTTPFTIPPVLTDPNITIRMAEADVPILEGPPTRMWTFNGTFPGPTIRRPSGQTTKVTFVNELPEAAGSMTIHHHGNHSASSEDGQPDDHLIAPHGSRTYTYDFMEGGQPERAAFQWYHDHRMDLTARNVWMGLAGMVILDDEFDSALPLPKGEFDIPLMLAPRSFDGNNQLAAAFSTLPPPLDGVAEDLLLTNGAPAPFLDVADRKYRFRILNAGTLRPVDLALSGGRQMTQIATESGLLPAPLQRSSIALSPAERAEVIVDFSGMLRETVSLINRVTGSLGGRVVEFRVNRHVTDESSVPATLRPMPEFDPLALVRPWVLGLGVRANVDDPDGMSGVAWTINGLAFDPNRVDATVKLNSTEQWVFVNASPLQGHVVHIHDVDWVILKRNGQPPRPEDAGLRESFIVGTGETIVVTSKFTDHLGRYMLHCHMLQHEDHGLMAQFEVVA